MGTNTTNLNLYKPAQSETGWADEVNANFDTIDQRIFENALNVKDFGAKADGVTDDSGAIQDALDAASGLKANAVFLPSTGGVTPYFLADGVGLDIPGNVALLGGESFGGRRTILSVKNAYALNVGVNQNGSSSTIRGLAITMRSGATTGGALKTLNGFGNVDGLVVGDITYEGRSTITEDPGFNLGGMVGCYFERLRGVGNVNGCLMGFTETGFNNLNTITDSVIRGNTGGYGLKSGGSGCTFTRIDVLGTTSVILENGGDNLVEECWIEGADNDAIQLINEGRTSILHNRFRYFIDGEPTAVWVRLSNTNPNQGATNVIAFNHFQNNSPSGVAIEVGTNVDNTLILHNRNAQHGGSTIVDNGNGTTMIGGRGGSTQLGHGTLRVAGDKPLLLTGNAGQTGDNGDVSQSGIFAVEDAAGQEQFGITQKGYAVFATPNGDSGTGQLPQFAWLFYWDDALGQLRMRYRKGTGATGTAPVAYDTGLNTYTQTYSTADRTHANPTAAALTDSSGGTANQTVQALPDPADTPASADALRDDLVTNLIPALRNNYADIVDEVNKLITDLADVKQLVNGIIDDLQTAGIVD